MGAGAWGTALAKVLADAGNNVTLWSRRPELADEINRTHRNADYLDGPLPEHIRATSDHTDTVARISMAVDGPRYSSCRRASNSAFSISWPRAVWALSR